MIRTVQAYNGSAAEVREERGGWLPMGDRAPDIQKKACLAPPPYLVRHTGPALRRRARARSGGGRAQRHRDGRRARRAVLHAVRGVRRRALVRLPPHPRLALRPPGVRHGPDGAGLLLRWQRHQHLHGGADWCVASADRCRRPFGGQCTTSSACRLRLHSRHRPLQEPSRWGRRRPTSPRSAARRRRRAASTTSLTGRRVWTSVTSAVRAATVARRCVACAVNAVSQCGNSHDSQSASLCARPQATALACRSHRCRSRRQRWRRAGRRHRRNSSRRSRCLLVTRPPGQHHCCPSLPAVHGSSSHTRRRRVYFPSRSTNRRRHLLRQQR
jgi:hypothetical protein